MSSSLDWLKMLEAKVREGAEVYCFKGAAYGEYNFAVGQHRLAFFPEAWRIAKETGKKVHVLKIVGVVDPNDYPEGEDGLTPIQLAGTRFRPRADWELRPLLFLMDKPREWPVFQVDYAYCFDSTNQMHQSGLHAVFAPTRSSFITTYPCYEAPSKEVASLSLTQELLRSISREGRAVLPGGHEILALLEWDTHVHYSPFSGGDDHAWLVELGLQFHDDATVAVRQTILICSAANWRKHELSFAFEFSNLVSVETLPYHGQHPGRGHIGFRASTSVREFQNVPSPGVPGGLKLTFGEPVKLHRWSAKPITVEALDIDLTSYDVSIWFATEETAKLALETFNVLRRDAGSSALTQSLQVGLEAIPSHRLGQIQRD
ncbi:MAG: hypothetical protein EON58_04715 [Alphaproteobacteria bacterium]|nr:MAG: hypothetical protein EON58_04715 [Alphaproteobacteria bacterium]